MKKRNIPDVYIWRIEIKIKTMRKLYIKKKRTSITKKYCCSAYHYIKIFKCPSLLLMSL